MVLATTGSTTYQNSAPPMCRRADLVVGTLADDVQLALELVLVGGLGAAADEHLAHERLGGLGRLAQHGVVGRHGARSRGDLALRTAHVREHFFDLAALRRVARHEDVAGPYSPGSGRLMRAFLTTFLEEGVRHLHQHAGAVAGVDLAAAGAAMIEVLEDLDALLDDRVRLVALDVHDEADAASVMLELRVIEALLSGRPCGSRRSMSRVPMGAGACCCVAGEFAGTERSSFPHLGCPACNQVCHGVTQDAQGSDGGSPAPVFCVTSADAVSI